MVVVAVQAVGDVVHTWVVVAGERQFIDVTVESARRLHAALGVLLADVL